MLLAIDTATARASIALHDGTNVRGECTWEATNRHTVTLIPRIHEMLAASELGPEILSAVGVCIGPGSYTGVRIGVAAAKGLTTARHLPLVGISTLDILVAAQPADPRPLYALFAAGRKRVGYAVYRWQTSKWQAQTEVAIASLEELADQIEEPALVVGEIPQEAPVGREIFQRAAAPVTLPSAAYHVRRAGFLADLAWERLRAGQLDHPATLAALYVR